MEKIVGSVCWTIVLVVAMALGRSCVATRIAADVELAKIQKTNDK